jgi:hypothetical protein
LGGGGLQEVHQEFKDGSTDRLQWRLQEFDLDIQYRKGKNSCNVDGLTRDSTAPLRPYGEDSVEQLYETNNVAVTTKLKAYLKSVMPKDDQENTDDGMDEKLWKSS